MSLSEYFTIFLNYFSFAMLGYGVADNLVAIIVFLQKGMFRTQKFNW